MDKDLRQLRSLIREALGRSAQPTRSLEDELGIGHGNLAHLLSGQLELKVRHLLSISRLLGVPPHRLIELGCPEALAASTRDVTDLVSATAPASGIGHVTLSPWMRSKSASAPSCATSWPPKLLLPRPHAVNGGRHPVIVGRLRVIGGASPVIFGPKRVIAGHG